jgi:hypothetical protein
VSVDRVEHPKGNGTDRLPRLRTTDHLGHDTGDDGALKGEHEGAATP